VRFTMSGLVVGCASIYLLASAVAAAPDEERLGKSAGYPVGTRANWFFEEKVRVGSFSHLDKLYPHNRLPKAGQPSPLPAAATKLKVDYKFEGRTLGIDDFLARQRVTGLLIVKDGEILVERYQYDRLPSHRLLSQSIAKPIVCLAVGLALAEGRIASLDDKVSKYVRELAGYPYGETSIRNILRMASGVRFSERYDGRDDLSLFTRTRSAEGAVKALRLFTAREAAEGARFHYASSETVVLALVVRAATGQNLSDYLAQRLWQPMGAEADATWSKDATGLEYASGQFNAVLRDYGRLGMLLANDGASGGKNILPKDFLLEATDWRKQPAAFAPRKATGYFGYGYQFWTFPGEKRRFALLGVYGQSIFVDPGLKLAMVITGVAKTPSVGTQSFGRERLALWEGLVRTFGKW
jgi:CubicO group peptidase (beta-lactamase class C family)